MAHLGEELKKFEKELDKIELLQLLETKTKVPKLYLVGGAAALVFLLVLFGVLDSLITNLIGFIYPAYVTLQTIENPTRETSIQWTTYWVWKIYVASSFHLTIQFRFCLAFSQFLNTLWISW